MSHLVFLRSPYSPPGNHRVLVGLVGVLEGVFLCLITLSQPRWLQDSVGHSPTLSKSRGGCVHWMCPTLRVNPLVCSPFSFWAGQFICCSALCTRSCIFSSRWCTWYQWGIYSDAPGRISLVAKLVLIRQWWFTVLGVNSYLGGYRNFRSAEGQLSHFIFVFFHGTWSCK